MFDLGTVSDSRPLVVDCFAGGGGASSGIEAALGRPVDVAINHDEEAIAMHKANHPRTKHYCKSIYEVSPHEATQGRPVALAWFSPDCKHFSKAKGARPVKRIVRDLAWTAVEWARRVRPKVIILENVEEFRKWGPVNEDGKPCKEREGQTFQEFVAAFKRLGYKLDYRDVKACDHGTPTIRKRLFLIARRDGLPIVWPEPTHGPGLLPYRTAAEIIDWSVPCRSIFGRKRPLKDTTHRRIAKGIVRYVLEASNPFILPASEQGEILSPYIVGAAHGDGHGRGKADWPITEPLRVVTGSNDKALVCAHVSRQFGRGVGRGIDEPAPTVTAGGQGKSALVAAFMAQHNTGVVGHDIRKPVSTLTSRCTQQQIVAAHLTQFYGSNEGGGGDLREPLPAVTGGGNHAALVSSFLIKYYGEGGQWQGCGEPLGTVTTRDRFGVVVVDIAGEPWVIVDIRMRMLTKREQFRAQGFEDSYIIDPIHNGKRLTGTSQQRMCGNSVCRDVAEVLVRANAPAEAFAMAAAA